MIPKNEPITLQETQALTLQTRYLIRKMLDIVPGTAAEVSQKLSALLQHSNAGEDKSLQQIGFLLENPETKDIATATIKERLALLRGS